MRKLIKWAPSQGAWTGSELSLPALDAAADAAQQRWCIVAGGLALILSRISATERSARFRCTHALYEHVRASLRDAQLPVPSLDLLSEVMHETAEISDPLTRNCLKACFHAGLRAAEGAAAAAGLPGEARGSQPASSMPFGARSSQPSAASGTLTSELLIQRSAALRRKLADARNTGFADLK